MGQQSGCAGEDEAEQPFETGEIVERGHHQESKLELAEHFVKIAICHLKEGLKAILSMIGALAAGALDCVKSAQ